MHKATVVIISCLLTHTAGYSQCVVGQNMPPPLVDSGDPVSLPEHLAAAYNIPDVGSYTIPSTLVNAVVDAIQNWGDHFQVNNSDISFYETDTPPGNGDPLYPDDACSYPNCWSDLQPWISVGGAPASDMGDDVGNSSCSWADFGSVQIPAYRCVVVSITISDAVTNDTYMTSVVAHELGHGMALDDCTTCDYPSTVMTSGQSDVNNTTDPQSPSTCDNQQVRQTAFPT